MDVFFIVIGVLVVAGVAATVKDLLLDGYRSRPIDRHQPHQEPTDRDEKEAPLARRSPKHFAPRHPRSLG